MYDRDEREFLGYGRVTEQHRDAANGDAVYRDIVREFRTDSFYTKGLLARMQARDGSGRRFTETEHTYPVLARTIVNRAVRELEARGIAAPTRIPYVDP